MKNLILSFCLIIICQISFCQNIDSLLIKKNRIESISETTKFYKKEKLISEKTGIRKFNVYGLLTEEFSYYQSLNNKYIYNHKNLLTKKIEFNKNNEISCETNYVYDNLNKLIKEVSMFTDFEGLNPIIYNYNSKNEIIQIDYINNDGNVYETEKRKFYPSGKILERINEEKYNKSAYRIERFDECGNRIYLFKNSKNQKLDYDFIEPCNGLIENDSIKVDTLNNTTIKKVSYKHVNKETNYLYNEKKILIETQKLIFDENKRIMQSEEKFYNNLGQIIKINEFYYFKNCNMASKKQIHDTTTYIEYFENGLKRKEEIIYNNQKIKNITEYQIHYY